MPKTLVTGATGLLGSHLVRALLERGDEVRAMVRARSRLDNLHGLEVEMTEADALDRRRVRAALKDVDRVFHAAGATALRWPSARLFDANAGTTRVVLEEALRAQVERVVHVSSVAAVGPAPKGSTADETQAYSAGRLGLPYVDSKHAAEVEAMRLAAQGLPVVIVNPAHILGPGDLYRSSTEVVRRFMRREIPAYVDGTLNIVGVEDVAHGALLADERGRVGERYILGNRNFTLDRLFADLGRLSGVEPPAVKLPLAAAIAFARVAEAAPVRAPITVVEVVSAAQNWAFRSTKAKRELGWKPSPHEDCLEETVEWYRSRESDHLSPPGTRQPLPFRITGDVLRRSGSLAGRFAG